MGRRKSEQRNFKYTKVPVDFDTCIYCGRDAGTVDHVPPISHAEYYDGDLLLVPACGECNRLLSDKYNSIGKRAHYLVGVYQKRYKHIIKMPEWTEEELDELGENMRIEVEFDVQRQRALKYILKRLRLTSELYS